MIIDIDICKKGRIIGKNGLVKIGEEIQEALLILLLNMSNIIAGI
jgi:hypothetical protein